MFISKDHTTNRIPNTICLGCETPDITSPQIKNTGTSCVLRVPSEHAPEPCR